MIRFLTILWISAAAAVAQNEPPVAPAAPAAPAPAPEAAEIRVRIAPTVLAQGQNATLTYSIDSAGIPPRIDEYPRIRVDGLDVEYAGTAQRANLSNGGWTRSLEMR